MRGRSPIIACLGAMVVLSGLYAQRAFRAFPEYEDDPAPLPPDANERTEWAFARLRYPAYHGAFSYRWGESWPTDFPKADRQFVQGVRRLTRLHTRSVEQIVDFDGDDLYNWPWIYAVEVGHWDLSDAQARKLREYLLRGGFLMVDDFHGTMEWQVFIASMNRVFPDRSIANLSNDDPIFHVVYDLQQRVQVPGLAALRRGVTFEFDGYNAEWKGIHDDRGRVMVAICHNMDLGDAWEWADASWYPERYASLAYRIGVNYILYSMTH